MAGNFVVTDGSGTLEVMVQNVGPAAAINVEFVAKLDDSDEPLAPKLSAPALSGREGGAMGPRLGRFRLALSEAQFVTTERNWLFPGLSISVAYTDPTSPDRQEVIFRPTLFRKSLSKALSPLSAAAPTDEEILL